MKFWQAVVPADMAAGAVWADRLHDAPWIHLAAAATNVLANGLLWAGFKALFSEAERGA